MFNDMKNCYLIYQIIKIDNIMNQREEKIKNLNTKISNIEKQIKEKQKEIEKIKIDNGLITLNEMMEIVRRGNEILRNK